MRIGVIVPLALLLLAFSFLYPLVSSALTAEEIQTQIQSILARIAELKTVLTTLQDAPAGAAPAPSLCFSLSRTLSRGSGGEDVKDLQNFLIKEGMLAEGNTTGYFGPLTEAAVRAWQSAHGIVASGDATSTGFGIVGPKTRIAMLAGCASPQNEVTTAPVVPMTPATSTTTQTSSPPFSRPSISISAPRAGVAVAGGNTLRIAWQSTNTPPRATVTLSLLGGAGERVGTITQSIAPSGEYLWRVPQENSTDCPPGASAFDCVVNITACSGSKDICTLPSGVYRIGATLSGGIGTTSSPFQIGGGALADLLVSLGAAGNSPDSSSTLVSTSTGLGSPSGVSSDGCIHDGQPYEVGTTISVACGSNNCPSSSSGTGFITAQCTGERWCIPFTAYCAASIAGIDVSAYEGGGAGAIKSGYSVSCPQEGYRAYLSCPYGGCVTGWNTCKRGTWVRDEMQSVVPVGTQGPCQGGYSWCEVGTEHGFGCVPAAQCVNGKASL